MDIRLENLSIGYKGEKPVAAGINTILHGRELSCLIGSNGIGKSTLLKTIAGFLPAVAGTVWLDERDVAKISRQEMAVAVSVVLTGSPDVKNLTAREMVVLGRSPYMGFWGGLSADDDRIVNEAIKLTDIASLGDRKVDTLSDGERQKVMIARALAQQTPVILLDEPTAFLDYPSKIELMKLLCRLAHEKGKAVVLSTHDLNLAMRLADRLFLLADGKLEEESKEQVEIDIARLMKD